MELSKNEIINLLQDSEKVLVGIGEEFSNKTIDYKLSPTYLAYKEKLNNQKLNNEAIDDEFGWLDELIDNYYINHEIKVNKLHTYQAYQELFHLLKNKDYFIINLNSDGLMEKAGFQERVVYPCGSKSLYQCSHNCSDEVENAKDIDTDIIESIRDKNKKLSDIKRPVCKKCGQALVYNRVESDNYCEKGYLNDWKEYMEWTSRTLNKSVCILELGVNFQYPTVIRWPFEKISYINNKAQLVRINEKFNQTSSEVAEKTITIKENSIEFLLK